MPRMIWKSYLVLQLALLTHLSRAKMENNKVQNVVGASVFRRGQMVKEGSLVRLTCHTERPWFFCLWQSPGEDRQCAINFQEMDPETVCKGKRLALQGTEEACNLQIEAEPSDHGAWMCLVTYDDDFDTSKVFIDLEVAVKATLVIYVDEAQEEEESMIQQSVLHKRSSADSDIVESEDEDNVESEEEDNVIHIDEGEVKSVTCSAMKAFPRSQLSWTLNNSTSSDLDDTSQALIKFYKDNHWVDTTQSVKLVGDMEHNNSTLECWAQQVNRTGHLVFVQSSSARINVHPVGAPLILTRTSESIGLLILIILLLLIVTFLCIILAIPTCRKRKRRRKQEEQRQALQNGGHVSNGSRGYDDGHVSNGSRGYVPNESSRRRASYDQNRNKLRIKREPFRDSILKAEELLDQAFEDGGDDPVVIVSDPKTSSVTFSERGTQISGPKYSLAGSQNNAPKFPSRAESQTSSHNSILKTDSIRSPPYPSLRGESQLLPSKSSSRASLSVSPLNAAASRLPDGDLFDTSVPVDQISFDDPIAPPDQISFENAPTDHINFEDHLVPKDQISFDDYPAPNVHISFDDHPAPIDRVSLDGSPPPLEHIKLVEAVDASDDGSVDDAIARDHDDADTLPMSAHVPHNPEAKDSVFFCREGCFNLSSPCTHIRVAIPRSTNV